MNDRFFRYIVHGRVQGVNYRKSVLRFVQEEKLSLRGFVRNLSDGNVEVQAVGSEQCLQRLEGYLKQGPMLARVTEVEKEERPAESAQSLGPFTVQY